jgi:DNA-binding SARP family transcriptional activator
VDFRLLGALAVSDGTDVLPIARGAQRAVLAVLLLNANHVVTTEDIIDEVWGAPPPTARASLQNNVMRLRRALGGQAGRLVTHSAGYEITVSPGELDVARFEQLMAYGWLAVRRGDWVAALNQLGAALALWRGRPFADVPASRIALNEGHRLAEMRLAATETCAEAAINLGRYGQAIADMTRLTHEEPLRERAQALLMTALCCEGQRGAALAAYQVARNALREQGLDPGWDLRELQRRILRGEPLLAAPGAVRPSPPQPAAVVSGTASPA